MLNLQNVLRRDAGPPVRGFIIRAASVVRNYVMRAIAIACVTAIALFTGACEKSTATTATNETCISLGLCASPPIPPIEVSVLCDASLGSTCSRETLEETLDVVLNYVARRPDSTAGLWMLGKSASESVVVAKQTVPTGTARSERSRAMEREKFVKTTSAAFLAAASHTFDEPPRRQSPLVETLMKLSISDARGLPRVFVVVTDAREVSSLTDFECARLPLKDSAFLERLGQRGLLQPGSLEGVDVHLAFVDGKPVTSRGCPTGIERDIRLRALWRTALTAAGAGDVFISTGAPVLLDQDTADERNGGSL